MVAAFDLVVNLLFIFVVLALIAVHAPKRPPQIRTEGLYAITIEWPAGSNDDVDLYVRDPSGNVAYFGTQDIGLMHLDFDDLGTARTGTQILPNGKKVVVRYNGEKTVIRAATTGEYTVDVHLYDKYDRGPTRVVVKLWRIRGARLVYQREVTLSRNGQDVTAFRFSLDAIGNVSGINRLPANLVGAMSG